MTSRSGSHQDCSWKGSVPHLETKVYYRVNSSFPANYKIGRGESNCANVCLLSLLPRKLPTLVCRAPHRNATCMIMYDICYCDPLPSLSWLQEDEEGVPGRGSDPEVQRLALASVALLSFQIPERHVLRPCKNVEEVLETLLTFALQFRSFYFSYASI